MFHTTLLFLNIGSSEMILILGVALLLFGGEKLPELARGLGKGIRDFKEASEDVKREISNQINNFDEKKPDVAATPALPEAPAVPNTYSTTDYTGTQVPHIAENADVVVAEPVHDLPVNDVDAVIEHHHDVADLTTTTIEDKYHPVAHDVAEEHHADKNL